MSTKPDNRFVFWLSCLSLLGFLPWIFVQWQTSIHGDMAWLLIAAERLLGGQSMSAAYYDPNPPLSVILHTPPVFLSGLTGAPVWTISFLLALLLIIGSAILSARILTYFSFLNTLERFTLLLTFGAGATILASVSFAERDHLIGVILFPFILAQLGRSWSEKMPRGLQAVTFGLGTFFILIKPHFGIIPAVILLHRCAVRRDLSAVRDLDFLCLSVGTIAYLASIALFFPDYMHIIFPDVLSLYLQNQTPHIALPMLLSGAVMFTLVLVMELFLSDISGPRKKLMVWLYCIALLCLIPFAVQMKGYYYQILPAYLFFLIAFCYSLVQYVQHYVSREIVQYALTIILVLALAYSFRPLVREYPHHADYKSLPMATTINAYCPKESCNVFIFHNSIEIAPQSVLYAGHQWASRFPSFWFIPGIHAGLTETVNTPVTPAQALQLRAKYADMLRDDFQAYSPDILLIMNNFYFADGSPLDFFAFFEAGNLLQDYEKAGSVTIDQGQYFSGTNLAGAAPAHYDIYAKSSRQRSLPAR